MLLGPLHAFSLFTFHLPPLLHHTYSSPLPPISILPPPSPLPLFSLQSQLECVHFSSWDRTLKRVHTDGCHWWWMGCHGHQQTAAMVVDSGWGAVWGGLLETPVTLAGWGGRLAIVYQVVPCGSRSDFLLVHVNQTLRMCLVWWCGYWMTDKRNSSTPLTPSHSHTEQWIWSVVYITIVHCCVSETSVWDICMRCLSVGLGKLFRNNLRIVGD